MNTILLILVILAFLVFDRIVRHKPEDEAKRTNSPLERNEGEEHEDWFGSDDAKSNPSHSE